MTRSGTTPGRHPQLPTRFDGRGAPRLNGGDASVVDAPHRVEVNDGALPREEVEMRRAFGFMVAALALSASMASAGVLPTPNQITRPDAVGDQLIYYYDARANFTTFMTILNSSGGQLTVSVLFYGPTFSTPLSQAVTLAGGALTIIDVGSLHGSGLPAQPGIAIATAVDLAGRPVTSGALTGNFTVANLLTQTAFGAPAAARSARRGNGELPDKGTVIDGSEDAAFVPIRPTTAVLGAYYNPDTLAPVENGGNQLIFVNFEDDYTPSYSANIGSTTWTVSTTRSNGAGISESVFTANGVTVTDLASVAGAGVNGASGSMFFVAETSSPRLTRMIYFTEALGTFGTGYLLPPIDIAND
jgi:hypothetical protein